MSKYLEIIQKSVIIKTCESNYIVLRRRGGHFDPKHEFFSAKDLISIKEV